MGSILTCPHHLRQPEASSGSAKKLLLIFFGLFGMSGGAAHAKQPKLTAF
jgi:hypothetical protein